MSGKIHATWEEIAAIAGKIDAAAEDIDGQAADLGHSEVARGDFGRDYSAQGSAYVEELRAKLINAVRNYAEAARTFATNISDVHRTHDTNEQDVTRSFDNL